MNTCPRALLSAALLGIAGLPASAAVGGIEGPWSILVAGTVPPLVTDGFFVPILASSIDGESASTYSIVTRPGKRLILLDTLRTAKDRGPSHKYMELDMAPCMRYYVAGKKSAGLSLRWAPEVFKVEPIGECIAEFKKNVNADTHASPLN